MIHHGCEYNDPEHPMIANVSDDKATTAVMGYDGRYRCGECKRRVDIDVDGELYESDLRMLPKAEPPYPDGYCGSKKV